MCCTFGDTTDKEWWYTHQLPLIEAIDPEGRLNATAGIFAGLPVVEARRAIIAELEQRGLVLQRQPTTQTVRVHERCDTPVEFIMSKQWFVRLLEFKEALLAAGEQVRWHPEHMQTRYRSWVENLTWDWCISRQRYYGVPFPLWYCQNCGEVMLANEKDLPVDPLESRPTRPCPCGSKDFTPEEDVMDTWATSSLSPQIVGGYQNHPGEFDDDLYRQVFPFSLRPQAHEIIRTWAFYTLAKSIIHFGELPWSEIAISGWGIAGEGTGKISKSRGGGPLSPSEVMERYSADAVRYWAASTGLGKDAIISEEKIQVGAKLITKLWNVARFSQPFLAGFHPQANQEGISAVRTPSPMPPASPVDALPFTPADRWVLSSTQRLIRRVTQLMDHYDYAAAKSDLESFFWREFTDNYLEMCKQRLYDEHHPQREATRFTLNQVLLNLIKMFAPFLPYVTEEIYLALYAITRPEKPADRSIIHLAYRG
jgi:valyl-tRNA synthetase